MKVKKEYSANVLELVKERTYKINWSSGQVNGKVDGGTDIEIKL